MEYSQYTVNVFDLKKYRKMNNNRTLKFRNSDNKCRINNFFDIEITKMIAELDVMKYEIQTHTKKKKN